MNIKPTLSKAKLLWQDLIARANQRLSLEMGFDGCNLTVSLPEAVPVVSTYVTATDNAEVIERFITEAVKMATGVHFERMLPEDTEAQSNPSLITWKMDDMAFQTEIIYRNHPEFIQLITTVSPRQPLLRLVKASPNETTMVRAWSFTKLPGKEAIEKWAANLCRDYILRKLLLAELRSLEIPFNFNDDGIVLNFGFTNSQWKCVTEVFDGMLWYRCEGAVKQHDLEKKQKADSTLNQLAAVVAPSPNASDVPAKINSETISTNLDLV